mmetsp:Transcript_11/g.78  ORF Transcript_11/g.78 Transcript_11/m.78 type:complete len:224 (-) Transcript_11:486-1157(-)
MGALAMAANPVHTDVCDIGTSVPVAMAAVAISTGARLDTAAALRLSFHCVGEASFGTHNAPAAKNATRMAASLQVLAMDKYGVGRVQDTIAIPVAIALVTTHGSRRVCFALARKLFASPSMREAAVCACAAASLASQAALVASSFSSSPLPLVLERILFPCFHSPVFLRPSLYVRVPCPCLCPSFHWPSYAQPWTYKYVPRPCFRLLRHSPRYEAPFGYRYTP